MFKKSWLVVSGILESMITHEFPLEQLDQALYKASDVNNSLKCDY